MARNPNLLVSSHRFGYVLAALMVLVVLFQFGTLQGEQAHWSSDSFQLLLHAENLLEGRAYADTGYIQNPDRYIAPVAYPLGFPLLLVPVLALFGADPLVLEALAALLIVAAAWGLAYLARPALPRPYIYGLALIAGMHPFLWELKQQLLSDLLFLLVVVLALLCYDRAVGREGAGEVRQAVGLAFLAGLLAGFAPVVRAVGIVVPMGLLLHDLVRFRRPSRTFWVMAVVGGMLYGSYTLFVDPNAGARIAATATKSGGYAALIQQDLLNHLEQLPRRMLDRAVDYSRAASTFVIWHVPLALPGSGIAKNLLTVLSLVPFGLGLGYRLRRHFGVIEGFCLLYVLSLLPWTFTQARYLTPVFLFFYFYLFVGLVRLSEITKQTRRYAIATAALVAGVFAVWYGTLFLQDETLDEVRVDNTVYAFVREELPMSAVLMTTNDPRPSIFFTERRLASATPPAVEAWPAYAERIGATHLLVGEWGLDLRPAIRHADSDYLRLVVSNDVLDLYEIVSDPPSASALR